MINRFCQISHCRYQYHFKGMRLCLVHRCSSLALSHAHGYQPMQIQHLTTHLSMTGQSGITGQIMDFFSKLWASTIIMCDLHCFRNDSINTGFVDPYNIEHSVVTTIQAFVIANESVRIKFNVTLCTHSSLTPSSSCRWRLGLDSGFLLNLRDGISFLG